MNRQSRLHCVINLLSRHLYPTSFFFFFKNLILFAFTGFNKWINALSLGSPPSWMSSSCWAFLFWQRWRAELNSSGASQEQAHCYNGFCYPIRYPGFTESFFSFLNDFENPCMADCSAWMIHVFTKILSFLIKTDSFALLVHVPDLVVVG